MLRFGFEIRTNSPNFSYSPIMTVTLSIKTVTVRKIKSKGGRDAYTALAVRRVLKHAYGVVIKEGRIIL